MLPCLHLPCPALPCPSCCAFPGVPPHTHPCINYSSLICLVLPHCPASCPAPCPACPAPCPRACPLVCPVPCPVPCPALSTFGPLLSPSQTIQSSTPTEMLLGSMWYCTSTHDCQPCMQKEETQGIVSAMPLCKCESATIQLLATSWPGSAGGAKNPALRTNMHIAHSGNSCLQQLLQAGIA